MKRILTIIVIAICCASCSTTVHFLCAQSEVALFVDDQFVGYGQISYVVPKGVDFVTVSCRVDGIEIYSKNYYVKHQNNRLFEVVVPDDYKYSSNPIIFKSH